MAYISIAEYYKRNIDKMETPQLIYNRIATGKMIKGKDWRSVEIKVEKKEVNEDYKI